MLSHMETANDFYHLEDAMKANVNMAFTARISGLWVSFSKSCLQNRYCHLWHPPSFCFIALYGPWTSPVLKHFGHFTNEFPNAILVHREESLCRTIYGIYGTLLPSHNSEDILVQTRENSFLTFKTWIVPEINTCLYVRMRRQVLLVVNLF